MEVKEMREVLKEAGRTVPRSNEDAEAAYNEYELGLELAGEINADDAEAEAENTPNVPAVVEPKEVELAGEVYTYIGAGDEPPHMINFMGRQQFIRGQAVRVTNPLVLEKISRNVGFVKGEADQDAMFASDKKHAKKREVQRGEDVKTQIAMDRKNK